jgi:hypothetical protein
VSLLRRISDARVAYERRVRVGARWVLSNGDELLVTKRENLWPVAFVTWEVVGKKHSCRSSIGYLCWHLCDNNAVEVI